MMKMVGVIWDGKLCWHVEGKRNGQHASRRFTRKAAAKAWRDEINAAERARLSREMVAEKRGN
jgi:hypothetical protein